MSFAKSKNDTNGKDKTFGNALPADERSNKGPTSGTQTIGVVKGRLTFSKTSVAGLNTGVCPVRDDN